MSASDDRYELRKLSAYLGYPAVIISSPYMKLFTRQGDALATGFMKLLPFDQMIAGDTPLKIVAALRYAFLEPTRIMCPEEREPRVCLFLCRALSAAVSSPPALEAIHSTLTYLEQLPPA